MVEASHLHCPVRGQLRSPQRAADGLTFTEEKNRIDALRYLIQKQYPKENFGVETTLFRLGNKGRNSFRTDFAVYDTAFEDIRGKPFEARLQHLRLLAEIKRENTDAENAKATQVIAALNHVPDIDTLGVYWDDVEQRFFYRQLTPNKKQLQIHEAPISKIPAWGLPVGSTQLTYKDLDPARDLVRIFREIEDALHVYIVDKSARYELIQQLLLTKIHDEQLHSQDRAPRNLEFQDFSVEALGDSVVLQRMTAALKKAAGHYNQYLPKDKRIDDRFTCPAAAMREATRILAPVNILGSKVQVIQAFYMKFAKDLYKWDLAQYFTPHEVIDFIVKVVNPQVGEHVKDPACGSADFLISAFRHTGRAAHDCVWGSDNDPKAVQISVLNMVLNGDGKTQILHEDSLESYGSKQRSYSVVLCNPPFGTKIVEKRFEVLRKFDLAHRWEVSNGRITKTDEPLPKQQTGLLFAELCVRLTEPGGRIGIILPNGYLGNIGAEYHALREWLLCHTKLVGIVSFPRFTFKKSGADVSASAVFLEKRDKPLRHSSETEQYPFHVGIVESVGWWAGDKNARPVYCQDPESGEFILDEMNEPIIDADFPVILDDFLRSPAADEFPWLIGDRQTPSGPQTRGLSIGEVTSLPDLCLDPKRYSAKYLQLREEISDTNHFTLGDVLEWTPSKFKPIRSEWYQYTEIDNAGRGEYEYQLLRGWELPGRARLLADPGDFFLAHVWASIDKWFMATGDCSRLVVTSGFSRFKIRKGKEELIPDLAAGLCSEAYRVQMRALSRGSDGLALITNEDILQIALPRIQSKAARAQLQQHVDVLRSGVDKFSKAVQAVMENVVGYPVPPDRKSHCSLV